MPIRNYWTWARSTLQKNRFFWSNLYEIKVIITSLIVMLELPNFGHMKILQYDLSHVIKLFWWRLGQKLWRHKLYMKTSTVLLTWSKFQPCLLKKSLKNQKKLKELCVQMQSISVFIGIVKFAGFRWKNADASRTQVVSTWFIYFLDFLCVRYNWATCHHCRICKTYFKEGSLFGFPNPWAASKKMFIINRVKIVLSFSSNTL